MTTIRVLAEADVPAVVALFERVYPEHRWSSRPACEAYFREMFFDNPWRDPELPSWVAEEDGRISGCYAVMPRRMLLKERPIRVAVGCQFLVDPDTRRFLTALQLVKAVISGPQDLTIADGASEQARRIWIGIGGAAPLLYNLHWTRPLRPARYALSLLEQRAGLLLPVTLAARPLAAMADVLAARTVPTPLQRDAVELAEEPIDPAAMVAELPDMLRGAALQPEYDTRSLAWLLDQAARNTRRGTLRARAVRDGARRLIGWYLYGLRAGGASEVIQLAARNGCYGRVFQRLLADAGRHGAAAVRGRLDPHAAREFSDRHCWLRADGPWTLIHSRHPGVMSAIERGSAFLSRLDGEWWLRFLDEGSARRVCRTAPGTGRPGATPPGVAAEDPGHAIAKQRP
jgi:hypothetical protein